MRVNDDESCKHCERHQRRLCKRCKMKKGNGTRVEYAQFVNVNATASQTRNEQPWWMALADWEKGEGRREKRRSSDTILIYHDSTYEKTEEVIYAHTRMHRYSPTATRKTRRLHTDTQADTTVAFLCPQVHPREGLCDALRFLFFFSCFGCLDAAFHCCCCHFSFVCVLICGRCQIRLMWVPTV